jgi:hypothetical protein
MPLEWKAQHDFDLHIALEGAADLVRCWPRARRRESKPAAFGARVRALDLFRDPNGYADRTDREDAPSTRA